MTRNRKGRAGWHQTTLKTSKHNTNFTGIAGGIKAVIVTLAVWGLVPVAVAEWLINLGGWRND